MEKRVPWNWGSEDSIVENITGRDSVKSSQFLLDFASTEIRILLIFVSNAALIMVAAQKTIILILHWSEWLRALSRKQSVHY